MAKGFNLTAQINLKGPNNLKPIVADIKRQIGSVELKINPKLDARASKSITAINTRLKTMNNLLVTAKNNTDSLSAAFSNLSASLVSASSNSVKVAGAIQRTSTNAATTAQNIKQASTAMEEFGKQGFLAIKRFAAFSIVSTTIFSLINAINSGLSAFISFDKQLIKLQQVTGESATGLKSLEKTITQLSTGLGVSSENLIEVASTLAQAGLNAEETRIALSALAKTELAPSFDDLTSTTEGAIAALRQFELQAGDLEAALGSINAVAAAFAVESSDIIAAIQRTGGVFASASKGISEGKDALNEFIAIFTSVRQTTRESAETIATGLRTIFTRIQRSSTIQALKDYGIELTDLEGKFVGPFEAVMRLSKGLQSLDPRDLRFSQIVEELGGFRQIGKVIPLIQQAAVAQKALSIAQKGQSSLTEAQVIAQQSLANQISKVREQFLALFRDIGQSKSFQVITKGILGLTSAFISLAGAFKPILPFLAVLGTIKGVKAIGEFGAGFFGSFAKGGGSRAVGSNIGTSITGSSLIDKDKKDTTNRAVDSIRENTTAIKSLTIAVNALNTTISSRPTAGLYNGGKVLGFNSGGIVPGSGKGDKVPALLEPGEVVINNKAANKYGRGNLVRMNKLAKGGYSLYVDYADPERINPDFLDQGLSNIINDGIQQFTPRGGKGKEITSNSVKNFRLYRSVKGSILEESLRRAGAGQEANRGSFDYESWPGNLPAFDYMPSGIPADARLSKNRAEDKDNFRTKIQSYLSSAQGSNKNRTKFGAVVFEPGDDKTLQLKSGGTIKRFVGGGVATNSTGIYDSDKIGGSIKQSILGAILDSGKPYDVLHGPAGSGKTTLAQKMYGDNFILSAEDITKYAEFLILSGAGITKSGDFSPALMKILSGARSITSLNPDTKRLEAQRQTRIDQAILGGLQDTRSLSQLEATKKAPGSIASEVMKKFGEKTKILSSYNIGGKIQNFKDAGLVEEEYYGQKEVEAAKAARKALKKTIERMFVDKKGRASFAVKRPVSMSENISQADREQFTKEGRIVSNPTTKLEELLTEKIIRTQATVATKSPQTKKKRGVDARLLRNLAKTGIQSDDKQIVEDAENAIKKMTPEQIKQLLMGDLKRAPEGEYLKKEAEYKLDPEFRKITGLDTGVKGGAVKQFEALAKENVTKGIFERASYLDRIPDALDQIQAFRANLVKKLAQEKDPKIQKNLQQYISKANTAIDVIKNKKGTPELPGQVTALSWAVRQSIPGAKELASGGLIQKFGEGTKGLGGVQPISINPMSQDILNKLAEVGGSRRARELLTLDKIKARINTVKTTGKMPSASDVFDKRFLQSADATPFLSTLSSLADEAVELYSGTTAADFELTQEQIAAARDVAIAGFQSDMKDLGSYYRLRKGVPLHVHTGIIAPDKYPIIDRLLEKQHMAQVEAAQEFAPNEKITPLKKEDRQKFGEANLGGYNLEAILALLGSGNGKKTTQDAIDFADGLTPLAASVFGVPPNIPTQAKLTVSSSNVTKALDGMIKAFAFGGQAQGPSFEEVKKQIMDKYPEIDFRISKRKSGFGYMIQGGLSSAQRSQVNFASNLGDLSKVSDQMAQDILYNYGPQIDPAVLNKLQKKQFAQGGSTNDTIPAMVSKGEAFVPPKLAKKIGYGKLHKMNQADRNGVQGFSGGGISIFKGPGSGTSDSIGPIGLPEGSFIIREKATKALGLKNGGAVGHFASGGLTKDEQEFIDYRARQSGTSTKSFTFDIAGSIARVATALQRDYAGRKQEFKYGMTQERQKLKGLDLTTVGGQNAFAEAVNEMATKIQSFDPSMQFEDALKAAQKLADGLRNTNKTNDELIAQNTTLKNIMDKNMDATEALTQARIQVAKEQNIEVGILKRAVSEKEIGKQQFIQSEEGKRFGNLSYLAPGITEKFSQRKLGQSLMGASDFFSGKGGRISKLFGNLGGLSGIGATLAVGSEGIKSLLPASTAANPNVAGTFGAISGAGAGLATGAMLGAQIAGPVGAMVAGIGGAVIGGIQGFFNAKNTQILTNTLNDVAKSSSEVDTAFKKLETEANKVNLLAAQKAFGQNVELQTNLKDLAFSQPPSIIESATGGKALGGAAVGALIGTFFGGPGVGTAIGAGVGYLGGAATDYFSRPSAEVSKEAMASYIQQAGVAQERAGRLADIKLAEKSTAQLDKIFKSLKEGTGAVGPTTQEYIDAVIAAKRETGKYTEAQLEQQKALTENEFYIQAYTTSLKQSGIAEDEIRKIINKNREAAIEEGKKVNNANELAKVSLQRLARATKEVTIVTESLLDVYRRIDAGLTTFSTNVDSVVTNIENSLNPEKISKINRANTEEAILSNTLGYRPEIVTNAINDIVTKLGGGEESRKLGKQAEASVFLQQTLPALLRTGTTQDLDKTLRENLEKFLGNDKELINTIISEITAKTTGTGTNKEGLKTLASEIEQSGIGQVSITAAKALEILQKASKTYNDALDKTTELQNQWIQTMSNSIEYNRKANQIRIQSEIDLRKTLGKDISLQDLNRSLESDLQMLTGGPTDVQGVSDLINKLKKEGERLNLEQITNPGKLVSKALMENKLNLDKANKALNLLAENGDRANNTLEKIGERQNRAQSFSNLFTNIFTGGVENRIESIRQFRAVTAGRQALATGNTGIFGNEMFVQDFQKGLGQLKDILPKDILQDIILKSNVAMAEQVGINVDESIKGLADIFGSEYDTFRKVFGLVAGQTTKEDPLVAELQRFVSEQQNANKILGETQLKLAEKISTEGINPLLQTLREELPKIIGQAYDSARSSIEGSVQAAAQNQQNRAKGGIVYANKGQYIDFQPKGTDTVPAMLTPGEFVVNAEATKNNLGLLHAINDGKQNTIGSRYANKGGIVYAAEGGLLHKKEKERKRQAFLADKEAKKQATMANNPGYAARVRKEEATKKQEEMEAIQRFPGIDPQDAIKEYRKEKRARIQEMNQRYAGSVSMFTSSNNRQTDDVKTEESIGPILSQTEVEAIERKTYGGLTKAEYNNQRKQEEEARRARLDEIQTSVASTETPEAKLEEQRRNKIIADYEAQQKIDKEKRNKSIAERQARDAEARNRGFRDAAQEAGVKAKEKAEAKIAEQRATDKEKRAADKASIEAGTNAGVSKTQRMQELLATDPAYENQRKDFALTEYIKTRIQEKYSDDLTDKKDPVRDRANLERLISDATADYNAKRRQIQEQVNVSKEKFANQNVQIGLQQFQEGVDKSPLVAAGTAIPKAGYGVIRAGVGYGVAGAMALKNLNPANRPEDIAFNNEIINSAMAQGEAGLQTILATGADLGYKLGLDNLDLITTPEAYGMGPAGAGLRPRMTMMEESDKQPSNIEASTEPSRGLFDKQGRGDAQARAAIANFIASGPRTSAYAGIVGDTSTTSSTIPQPKRNKIPGAYQATAEMARTRINQINEQEANKARGLYKTDETTTLGQLLKPENVQRGATNIAEVAGEGAIDAFGGASSLVKSGEAVVAKGLTRAASATNRGIERVGGKFVDIAEAGIESARTNAPLLPQLPLPKIGSKITDALKARRIARDTRRGQGALTRKALVEAERKANLVEAARRRDIINAELRARQKNVASAVARGEETAARIRVVGLEPPDFSKIDTPLEQQLNAAFDTGKRKTRSQLQGVQKFNKGGIATLNRGLPMSGIGPDNMVAAIKSGEFIVNDKMSRKHLGLLHAINNNQIPKFYKGGQATMDESSGGSSFASGPIGGYKITMDDNNQKFMTTFIDSLNNFGNNFNTYIDKLSKIKLPDKIELTGNYQLQVQITGAAALEGLDKRMTELAISLIEPKLAQLRDEVSSATQGAIRPSVSLGNTKGK